MRLRRTYIILSIALPFVLSLLCACQREDCSGEVSEAASLCLNLSVPGLRIESKGNADNPFADDISLWSDWDKVVDGRIMYRLTVFLIEKDTDYLVAYRDIYYSTYSGSDVTGPTAPQGPNGWYNGTSVDVDLSSSTQAQISFLYDHPLHTNNGNSFERLQRGTYKLLAVANYSSVNDTKFNGQPDDVESYKGLGDGSFDTSVDGVIAEFKTAQNSGTKKKFADYTHYSSLVDYKLTSSSSFICPAMPQPLTLAKEIELSPGMNNVSGELLRTFSRIRLSVENMSNVDLTLHSLSFSDNTTKDQTYLFSLPESPDRIYGIGTAGAPVATSSDAIVPFTNETKINKFSAGDNIQTVFDAYILESRDLSNDYTYTLDLEYVGEAAVPQYEKTSEDAIVTVAELTNGGNYLFQNQNKQKRFLIASSDYLQTIDVELAELPTPIDEAMVMKLISVDSNVDGKQDTETIDSKDYPKYIIQTQYVGTTYYLGTPGRRTNIPMISNQSSATVFTVRDDRDDNLTFWSNTKNENGVRDYINVYGGQQDQVRGWNDNDGGSQFKLYAVNKVMKKPKYSDPIVLSTIDPVTSVVSPVNTIKRNDFINVLISVSYNKDLGDFEFEVKDWDEVSGSIEFN